MIDDSKWYIDEYGTIRCTGCGESATTAHQMWREARENEHINAWRNESPGLHNDFFVWIVYRDPDITEVIVKFPKWPEPSVIEVDGPRTNNWDEMLENLAILFKDGENKLQWRMSKYLL